jgi:iron complex outermembrane receptor protein
MAGATFRVVKGLSLFASYSKTYTPTSELSITGSGVVPSDNAHLLPPETGSGYDFGIKVDAFDSRLTGTLSFFQDERSGIASENLAATDADPRGFTGSRTIIDWTSGGLERTRGVEADLIYHVTQNYMFLFAGSYMPYAKTVTDPSTAPGSYIYQIEITDGRRLQNAPEQMVSIWNKYEFTTGPLQNFSVGAGLRYSSEIIPENNNLWGIVDPSFVTCEAMISYHTRTFGRSLTVQLNGRNLGNVTYYQGGIVQAPPREIFVNVALGF